MVIKFGLTLIVPQNKVWSAGFSYFLVLDFITPWIVLDFSDELHTSAFLKNG